MDSAASAAQSTEDAASAADDDADAELPQCKIKRNYSCNLCPFFSQNPRSFLYHSRDVHQDRIRIYECSQCLYASKHSQKLQRHVNMIHVAGKTKTRRQVRPIRPKPQAKEPKTNVAKPPEAVAVKVQVKVPEPKPPPPMAPQPPVAAAPLGEDARMEDVDVEEIALSDVAEAELRCSMCSFASRSRSLLRRHERVVHLKKRFLRCGKCAYVTHVKARFTKHVKYHSMPMIKCDLCDFRTPYKWNLDRHYKNHCGSGAFQCSKCNFRADIKQSLTVHEMNHHVPPVGQGALMARRKNKVGASETSALESDGIDREELELLRMEREDTEVEMGEAHERLEEQPGEDTQEEPQESEVKSDESPGKALGKRESSSNNMRQRDFIHPDDVVPRYGQIYVKNLKCRLCSYKAVFSHEIWRHERRIHGIMRVEVAKKDKRTKRPPPQLIPIQNKSTPPNSPILKIPAVKKKHVLTTPTPPAEKAVDETEFNEMCKKSSLTSSLKDFVSLIGDEEGLKTIPDSQGNVEMPEEGDENENSRDVEDVENMEIAKKTQTDMFKKKNASFFDKLKEKLLTSASDEKLVCEFCGHEAKCLSEAAAHQRRHAAGVPDNHVETDAVPTGAELSSTRCQHCRQRCKTSTDLVNHLKSCKAFGAACDIVKTEEDEEEEEPPMENRVFVWNELPTAPEGKEEEEQEPEQELDQDQETEMEGGEEGEEEEGASVYGTVTSKGSDNTESGTLVAEIDPRLSLTVKKVFKCPHCSFWASTASRFHVHIVGHLNKKPFECSLCLYRSNWRWDITKHIRLKSARDPSHLSAQVNMTDETGRRNYSKYNKYLTMMKVQEPSAESSGTGRRSRACDATQGTVAEADIIHPLPAPPRLTRAPTPGTSFSIPQGTPLRPPPPLQAAHQVSSQPPLIDASKRLSRDSTKKTLWKCKKCNYRDSNKERVLAHVKEHYGKKNCKSQSTSDGTVEGAQGKTPPFRCGHCHQVSNWKHVIQRHCKLKHNGDVQIHVGYKNGTTTGAASGQDASGTLDGARDVYSCDICPFTTDTEGDLTAHKLNHVDRPGSIFKCTYCPFYVPSKIAVLEHMEVHGIENADELATLKVDNFDPSECNDEFSSKSEIQEGTKRYKCRQCPYVSNSKTQFLYHKQFHRPRDAPFKCMYCSYNVTRRHLLHQHLRVHHMHNDSNATEQNPEESIENSTSVADINTVDMAEIPLVWVLKAGNFLKMFKCRWCPHVNLRKINIQEHEKMHQDGATRKTNKESATPQFKLQCPDCNYMCNNAGVLSSHVKVHQGFYGEIRSLVDPTRPDSEQIQNLQNSIRIVEPEVVIKVEAESEPEDGQEPQKEEENLSSQPECAYNRTLFYERNEDKKKLISFCNKCPARFFFKKELRIHSKFHSIRLPFKCLYCTYTARQRPHLLAHYKVHSQEYQERTTGLLGVYKVSLDCPQLKTVMISKNSHVIEGPVWMIVSPENVNYYKEVKPKSDLPAKPVAKHACHRCPAKFFKAVALQYHLTLHGGSHQHKCKYCDYTVKTYGNLIKHQLVHEDGDKNVKVKSKPLKIPSAVPISGTDLFYQRTEAQLVQDGFLPPPKTRPKTESPPKRKSDPQFGTLMHGSPEFIYPTYLKNGKVKEKRYKCHKCPSAFEKRDQYRIHLSLHGSKQKYRCEKCDYSVKYYANYVQHMRKHQSHDEALEARRSEVGTPPDIKQEANSPSLPTDYMTNEMAPPTDVEKKLVRGFELTLQEQQTLLLQERNKTCEKDEKLFWCAFCPYANSRRDVVESHTRRHANFSGVRAEFECVHCDYSAAHANFLREHIKLHFQAPLRHRPEAFLKCEQIELWVVEEKSKDDGKHLSELRSLTFHDRGETAPDRFFPAISDSPEPDPEPTWRMYVNPETGDPIGQGGTEETCSRKSDMDVDEPPANSPEMLNEDLIEMVEEQLEVAEDPLVPEERENPVVKPKVKRWRGKNWKCKKCPHAFGKKDQFLRHIALHGSNQRHSCDICDYSVKFYTNYVQHMRMHQSNEPDKVIFVKKNAQSLEENALKMAKEDADAACATDFGIFMNQVAELGEESRSFMNPTEHKIVDGNYGETDYSSMTEEDSSDDNQDINPVVMVVAELEQEPKVSSVAA